jgi:hypothetical protein
VNGDHDGELAGCESGLADAEGKQFVSALSGPVQEMKSRRHLAVYGIAFHL